MRDPVVFLWAIIGMILIAVVVTAARRFNADQKKQDAEDAKRKIEQDQLDQERINKGTHVRIGDKVKPRCCWCSDVATQKPYVWKRDDGFRDLLRRQLADAPARILIVRDETASEIACDAHDPLMLEEFKLERAADLADHAKLESLWETRRARFQREGVYERVKEKIEQHRVKVKNVKKSRSNVVPISKAAP